MRMGHRARFWADLLRQDDKKPVNLNDLSSFAKQDPEVTIVLLSTTGTTDLDPFVAGLGRKVLELELSCP